MSRDLIAILAFGLVTAIALVADLLAVWVKIPLALLFLSLTFAAICKVSPSQREWLNSLFSPDKGGALYLKLVSKPAGWPRDWRLYDWALRLALIYPIFFAVVPWVTTGRAVYLGGAPDQGGFEILTQTEEWWPRLALICTIALAMVAFKLEDWASASQQVFLRKVAGWLHYLAFAVAVAVAVAGAFAVAGAVVVAVAVAGAFAGAFAVAFAVAVAVAVAGAVVVVVAVAVAGAVVVVVAVEHLTEKGKGSTAYVLFTLVVFGALGAILFFLDWNAGNTEARSIFLFLAFLPIFNAIFDYPSYALTLTLLRRGYARPAQALIWALLDLGAALSLFFITGAGLVLTVALANHLSGVELYPLARLLADVGENPGQYWWLYAMVFSTVLPTMLHLSVATFSASAWMLPGWRAWILDHLDTDDAADSLEVICLMAVFFLASLVLPFVALFFLAMAANAIMPGYLGVYLGWLQDVACWFGPDACPG